ncbi:MAG: hypothetical protein GY859_14830, partial [Desulfobacterales bacterium]|nr:hypothetical protein [Desulfobacterales bacterium]
TFETNARAIHRVKRRLLRWGRSNFREYAWRAEKDPWLTFVAEFLLQRTRASQVEPVFLEIRDNYPTARSLVSAGFETVLSFSEKLGLRWRSPFLYDAAVAIADAGGAPPESAEKLQRLKGVGMYTAAAWLSLHRNKRAVIIDSNVARWLSRMTHRPYNRDPRGVKWIHDLADRLTPKKVFRDYNYAVLDFTMTICGVKHPLCRDCPLKAECYHGKKSEEQVLQTP